MRTLTTERLTLRGFALDDAADVFAYAQNHRVGPAAGWPPHQDREESERIVRMFIQADDVWAIVLKETGRVIGSIGLHKDEKRNHPKCRAVGYVLSEAHWGKGLMPEAVRAVFRHGFEAMGLLVISAYHYPFNAQSHRVMEKCGMAYEGTLRLSAQVYTGEIYDDVCFSITREAFFGQEG